ncbi:Nucleoside recognition [Candidatus Methanoperedenaceae archaeon GB50]|nr:MAG: Nucleoside recognition [Candidatus Methanoperedenaceae archaeon GB50]CAD7773944.1 Nucleoside recognition [Candidatus Methanoperedenaceae archaeon GB50]
MLIKYLFQSVILVTVGVVLANILVETNIPSRLSPLVKPLCKASNLPETCILSLFTTLLSATAGKSTLAELYRKGEITEDETIITVVMGTFPVVLGESLFRVQAPAALVILGPIVGGIYIVLNLFAALIQTTWALIYSKIALPPRRIQIKNNPERLTLERDTIKKGLKASYPTLKKIIPLLIITIYSIGLLLDHGLMNQISILFDPLLRLLGIPGECAAALAGQFIHYSVGYAIIGSFLTEGIITEKEAILTLLIGSMIIITLIYIKFSVSMYVSLFGRLGIKITAINYTSSMTAKMITIGLVLWLM